MGIHVLKPFVFIFSVEKQSISVPYLSTSNFKQITVATAMVLARFIPPCVSIIHDIFSVLFQITFISIMLFYPHGVL